MSTQDKDKLPLVEMLLSILASSLAIYLGFKNTRPVSTTPYIFIVMIMQILIFFLYKVKRNENEENNNKDMSDNNEKTPLIETITVFYIKVIAIPYSWYMMIVYLTLTSERYNT